MTIYAFTDGASRGNPGDAGIGVVLKNTDGTIIATEHRYLGKTTNNVAEYSALIACLRSVQSLPTDKQCSELVVHSDSELMVRQMNGQYKVRDEGLKKFYAEAQTLLKSVPFRFRLVHVPRAQNAEADALANEGIDKRVAV